MAPRSASPRPVEVEVGTGYLVGLGSTAPPSSGSGAMGIGVAVGLDYRLDARWALGIQGQYYDLSGDPSSPFRGVVGNLGATWHVYSRRADNPWLRLGTGYRLLWENEPSGASSAIALRQGFEIVTVTAGYDVPISQSLALAPVIGTGLDLFSTQVGGFLYAGLQGRFGVGD